MVVGYDFLKTFDLQLIAGRDYDEANKTDPVNGILINEAMVRHLGWGTPQNALGKRLRSLNGDEKVIGVFKDFHQTSLHEASGPFVLNMKEIPLEIQWFLKYMIIRIQDESDENALAYIENTWKEMAPDRPFEYLYLEDELADMYKDEENLSRLSLLFTFMIMFIAALGLIGLASFMAEQKTKEIGIRKVLGASIFNIIRNLTSEFVILVSVASIISWIISWFVMEDWLSRFPYRVTINVLVFVLAAFLAFGMAFIISSLRAWIAAHTNPVITLKYE
jgi:putative ABC transport system permease protein